MSPQKILWHLRINVEDSFCKRTKKPDPEKTSQNIFFAYFDFAGEFPGKCPRVTI